jgi:hypothetical protein
MGGHNCTAEINNQGRMKNIRFNQIKIRNLNIDAREVSKNKIKKKIIIIIIIISYLLTKIK